MSDGWMMDERMRSPTPSLTHLLTQSPIDIEQDWKQWSAELRQIVEPSMASATEQPLPDSSFAEDDLVEESEISDIDEYLGSEGEETMDVEDMGKVASKLQVAVQERTEMQGQVRLAKRAIGMVQSGRADKFIRGFVGDVAAVPEPKAMVTPLLEKSLTKQGYKIIGTHSGVKICRWTKSMLRGRGGCYKHSFYGIASHQCMETTPSLACANKCVFCWRLVV